MYVVETHCSTCQTPCPLVSTSKAWSVSVYAAIQENGNILLIRQPDSMEWTLPGGKVPAGDDVAESLRQQVVEATGVEILTKFEPLVRECPHKHNFLLYREAVPTAMKPGGKRLLDVKTQWVPTNRLPRRLAQHAKQYLLRDRVVHREDSPREPRQEILPSSPVIERDATTSLAG